MNYSPEQIKVGETLVKWMRNTGMPKNMARAEAAGLLKRHELKKLKSKMTQATSLKQLKGMLA